MSYQDASDLTAVVEAEQTSSNRPELSPEQVAVRCLIASFKEAIKADAPRLRTWKAEIRDCQRADGSGSAAVLQSQLSTERVLARARLLIYGTLRGRTWERMEPTHTTENGRLRYFIAKVWNAALDTNTKQTGTVVPMPDQIKVFE